MKASKRNYLVLATAAAAALAGQSVNAANVQWANTGTDWGTGANWSGGNVPNSNDAALLYNTGASGSATLYTVPAVDGAFSVKGISYRLGNNVGLGPIALAINRGAGATSKLTVGSSGITSVDSNTVNGMTINPDIVANGSQTWNTSNAALTVNGTLTGDETVTITKQGSGSLTLNGSITSYAGNINNVNGALLFATNSIYGGVISGNGFSVNSGVLTLTGANTYTGITNLTSGTARVSSLAINGSSGLLGTNATIKLGSTTSTGSIDYTGSGETATRTFDLAGGSGAGTTGSGTINNLGFGTLTISNITNSGASSTSTNSLILRGNVNVAGSVANASSGGKTGITAVANGTTTLSKANSFTGGLNATRGGTLIVDYASGGAVNSGNAIAFTNGGTLNLQATAPTPQTLGNYGFTDGMNRIILNNVNLTLGTVGRSSTLGAAGVFDVSNGGTLLADTSGTSGRLVDNVLVAGTTSTNFAGFLIRTGSGYDFASATSAAAGQSIIALGSNVNAGAFTTFTGSNGSGNTVNGRISSSGTTTIGAAAQTLGTLRVDTTSASGGTLAIGSGGLTLGKNALLLDGSGSYSLSGSGNLNVIGVYQYSSGTVTISSGISSSRIDKFGSGLLVNNSNSAFGSSGALGIGLFEGVYRAGTANALSAGRITIGTGGVLELAAGDLSRSLGTGTTNVNFIGDGGFSAFGSNRSVSLGSNLIWNNTANFLANGNKLILSSATSDSTIDFQSGIDFNGVRREVHVNNGSAAVDAKLTGALVSNNYAGGGLYKSGSGTLSVTNTSNSYSGGTAVVGGKLIAGTGAANTPGTLGTGDVSLSNSGTILEIDNSSAIADGATLTLAAGTTIYLNFTDGYEQVAVASFGGVVFDTPTLFTASDLHGVDPSYFQFANGTSGLQVVPEPSTLCAIALAGAGLLARRRRTRG